jgi:hypothetical protein
MSSVPPASNAGHVISVSWTVTLITTACLVISSF